AFLFRLMPKIGPFKPLKFEAPTPGAERLFLASLTETRNQFRQSLEALRGGHLSLRNIDFDTGRPSAHGEYDLADQTYANPLDTLADRRFERVSAPLRRNILAYYDAAPRRVSGKKEAKRMKTIGRQLAALRSIRVGDD